MKQNQISKVYLVQYVYYDDTYDNGKVYVNEEDANKACEILNGNEKCYTYWGVYELEVMYDSSI